MAYCCELTSGHCQGFSQPDGYMWHSQGQTTTITTNINALINMNEENKMNLLQSKKKKRAKYTYTIQPHQSCVYTVYLYRICKLFSYA